MKAMRRKQGLSLEMRSITKRFGPTVALDGVDLRVEAGEVLALVGENGAGKSTLMKILSGVYRPDSGTMAIDGTMFAPRNPHEARLAGVAMVYQELSIVPHLTIAENIVLGMEPGKYGMVDKAETRRRAHEVFEQLGHPDIHLHAPAGRLPVAEQQLAEIARAIAVGCRVLVLDEPTSGLSASDTDRLFSLVDRLRHQGHAIVYISHFLEEVKEISGRYIVLRDGKTAGVGATKNASTRKIVSLMVGRDFSDMYPRSKRKRGDVVLEVSELAGISKPVSASLSLHRGEVLGIAGLVGAGRSEFLRSIFGLDPVRKGKIRFGAYAGPASPVLRWEQGMGMVSEDRKSEGLAASLTVAENITLSKLSGFGPLGMVLPARRDDSAKKWIDRLNIRSLGPRQPVSALSGGNQQKVAIARLLHHDVDVLLLDEPTRGIDVGSKAEIYSLIDGLAVQGKAILIVSSYLPELLGVCDRVAVMSRGRLHEAHPAGKTSQRELMMEATGAA